MNNLESQSRSSEMAVFDRLYITSRAVDSL